MRGAVLVSLFCCLGFASFAATQTVSLDPRDSFLRVENDPGAQTSQAQSLSNLGFAPGDVVRLTSFGSYDRGGGFGTFFDLIGLFSTTNAILPGTQLNRVPGALDIGLNVATRPTNFGGSATDIGEDFLISTFDGSRRSVTIAVPNGAAFLFFGTADTYFEDNQTLSPWGVRLSKVTAVPLGSTAPYIVVVSLVLVVRGRRRHRVFV